MSEQDHIDMLTKYAGVPGTPYNAAVCYALDAIRENARLRAENARLPDTDDDEHVLVRTMLYRDGRMETWTEDQLREENVCLRAEIERLRAALKPFEEP